MKNSKLTTANINKEEGAAAVELALLLPILSLIIVGILMFGMIFHSFLEITHAAREGVRWAALRSSQSEAKAKAVNSAPGIDWNKATFTYKGVPVSGATDADQGKPVTVEISYILPDIVSSMINSIKGIGRMSGVAISIPTTIKSAATLKVE